MLTAQSDTLISGLVPFQSTQRFRQFSTAFPCPCCECSRHTPPSSAGWRHLVTYVTFRQRSRKFLRSKTLAKTMASKETFREAVCECTELKDLWTIRAIWADMMPAHLMSAAHSPNRTAPTRPDWFNETLQICMSHNLSIMGLLRSKLKDRISLETANTTWVFLQSSLLRG